MGKLILGTTFVLFFLIIASVLVWLNYQKISEISSLRASLQQADVKLAGHSEEVRQVQEELAEVTKQRDALQVAIIVSEEKLSAGQTGVKELQDQLNQAVVDKEKALSDLARVQADLKKLKNRSVYGQDASSSVSPAR